jgi:hypothetical protein
MVSYTQHQYGFQKGILIWSYALEEGKAHREMYSELRPNHPELVKG